MNRMKMIAPCALILFALLPVMAADQRARTDDGREVVLREDGTWSYINEAPKGAINREKGSVLQYTGKRGTFGIFLTPNVWKQGGPAHDAAEATFVHKDGDAFVMIIAERIMVPLDTLKKAALENARAVDENAAIVQEEKRKVNGTEILCLAINAKPEGIPVTYYGYYYSGEAGSIQVISYTGQNIFAELKPELDKFLNGFVILKKDMPKK